MRPDGLLYQNGDWGIYTGTSVGLDQFYSDVVHYCSKTKTVNDANVLTGSGFNLASYQIIGNTKCPGCGETQPDDIQTLWQLHNMDKPDPTTVWGKVPLALAKTSIKEINRIQKEIIIK